MVPSAGIEPYRFSTPIGYFVSPSTELGFTKYLNRASLPAASGSHPTRSGGKIKNARRIFIVPSAGIEPASAR